MEISGIKARLKFELNAWFVKQCRNPTTDYTFYYIASTNEHNGGFIICQRQPPNPEYKPAGLLSKGKSIDQNFIMLMDIIKKLPIIERGHGT